MGFRAAYEPVPGCRAGFRVKGTVKTAALMKAKDSRRMLNNQSVFY